MADINIIWLPEPQNTLQARPPEYPANAPAGQPVHVTWDPQGTVQSITVSIDQYTLPGATTATPYTGNQPVWDGTEVVWHDPHRTLGTVYEYTVSAYVENVGARTLDPKIINT